MGSGFKDWTAGDVLTAADVDGYLMRQTVMTFADASARDTALSGVLDEGMVAYLEDVNALTVYNGSAWVAVIDSDVLTVDTANNRVGVNDATPSYALDVTGDINATGDLRIGGTVIGEWTDYTPTVTTDSGTITSGSLQFAQYSEINDFVLVRFGYLVTTAGTAAGARMNFTAPSGLTNLSNSGSGIGVGRENAVTGASLLVLSLAASGFRIDLYTGGGWIQDNRGCGVTLIFKV